MGVNLASFPNSRINPTPATSLAVQSVVTVPANTASDPLTHIVAANPNRTYLTIYNTHATDSMRFMNYTGSGAIPTKAQILANGFLLIAGAAYEIDTPEAVFAISTTASTIPLDLEEGSG